MIDIRENYSHELPSEMPSAPGFVGCDTDAESENFEWIALSTIAGFRAHPKIPNATIIQRTTGFNQIITNNPVAEVLKAIQQASVRTTISPSGY